MLPNLTIEEVESALVLCKEQAAQPCVMQPGGVVLSFSQVLENLLDVMRENERLQNGLKTVDIFCMNAFHLRFPEHRAEHYAWSIQHARANALKALYPERAKENYFDRLITGDPFKSTPLTKQGDKP